MLEGLEPGAEADHDVAPHVLAGHLGDHVGAVSRMRFGQYGEPAVQRHLVAQSHQIVNLPYRARASPAVRLVADIQDQRLEQVLLGPVPETVAALLSAVIRGGDHHLGEHVGIQRFVDLVQGVPFVGFQHLHQVELSDYISLGAQPLGHAPVDLPLRIGHQHADALPHGGHDVGAHIGPALAAAGRSHHQHVLVHPDLERRRDAHALPICHCPEDDARPVAELAHPRQVGLLRPAGGAVGVFFRPGLVREVKLPDQEDQRAAQGVEDEEYVPHEGILQAFKVGCPCPQDR